MTPSRLLVFALPMLALIACSPPIAAPPTPPPATATIATPEVTMEATAAALAADGVITIADISDDNPAGVIEDFQPLADYLAANLGEYGITSGEVKVAPDTETMVEWLRTGEVDMFFDSPYPALTVAQSSGSTPILRRWKDGVEEYHTVFFARTDSGYDSLDDLQGQLVSFDEPYSTSGYMLPLIALLDADLTAVERPDTDATVAAEEVGYVFAGSDETSAQWVISGLVGAGVTDNNAYNDIPQETRDQLTIIHETESLPRHLVIVTPMMDAAMLNGVRSLLVSMDESDEGLIVLESFEETAQFDEFPDGLEAMQTRLQAMFDQVSDR